jgi:hypothetical protein
MHLLHTPIVINIFAILSTHPYISGVRSGGL